MLVLNLMACLPHPAKGSERVTWWRLRELRVDGAFDDAMAAPGGGSEALGEQKRGQGFAGGVVDHDVRAFGVALDEQFRAMQMPCRRIEESLGAILIGRYPFEFSIGD